MDLTTLLYTVGAAGFFTSRAFIPAFFTAVFLRYGEYIPKLGELEFIQATGAEPTWFTNNFTILGLGVLAIIEVGATKIPEAQEILDSFNRYAKTGVSALTTMGVLGAQDAVFIESTISFHQANVLDTVWSAAVAGCVYFFAGLRNGFMELLSDADSDDDLGIRRLISIFEDLWASVGIYFFLIFPLVILSIMALILGFFRICQIWALRKEESSKVECHSCKTLMYGSAPYCSSCKTPNPCTKEIGFFSQTKAKPVQDLARHQFRLISKRRCSHCATPTKFKKLPQTCPKCQQGFLESKEEQNIYLSRVRNRVPKVLGVTFVLSLIPILGIIPGIIYYRIQLVAPFRAYIPPTQGILLKWGIRILFFLLISLQIVPGAGGFVLPVMAIISYSVYRGYFVNCLSKPSTSS